MGVVEDHERAIVEAFFVPGIRSRNLQLVSTERGRKKSISRLAHLDALDTRYLQRIEPGEQSVDRVEAALKQRGAPASCYVVSEDPRVDGLENPLRDALMMVVGAGVGTFLSCVAGRLAYFEGEEPGTRHILER